MDRKSDRDNFHDRLTAALEAEDGDRLARELAEARTADIAESFDLLNDEERSEVLFALPPHTAAEVVVMLDEAVRGDVVDDLDTESLTEIVSELPPDDAADVLGELSEKEAEAILDHMVDEKKSDKIEELLEYGEETAGGIMTPDIVAVPATAAVADAIQHVRDATQEEDLHEVYIVDDDRRPVGMVPLRRLVTYDPATNSITFNGLSCEELKAGGTSEIAIDLACGDVDCAGAVECETTSDCPGDDICSVGCCAGSVE